MQRHKSSSRSVVPSPEGFKVEGRDPRVRKQLGKNLGHLQCLASNLQDTEA